MNTLTGTARLGLAATLLAASLAANADTFSGTRLLPVGTESPIVTTAPARATTEATYVIPRTPPGPVDRKTFAGSFCKPDRGSQLDDVDYNKGGIYARDGRYPVVVCPIARDNTVNTDGVSVALYVDSRGPEPVGCTLFSRSPYGDELARHTRIADDWGKSVLEFQVPAGADSGYYVLLCNLADGSRLFSYTVAEFTDTSVDY